MNNNINEFENKKMTYAQRAIYLKHKLLERFNTQCIDDSNEVISLNTVIESILPYLKNGKYLSQENIKKAINNTNNLIRRASNPNIPFIDYIKLTVNTIGSYKITISYSNYERGIHFIKNHTCDNPYVYFINNHEACNYLNSWIKKWIIAIENISKEYPELPLEWTSYKENYDSAYIGDNLLKTYINLNNGGHHELLFDDINDTCASTMKLKDGTVVYDYLEMYRNELMRKIPIKIESLNPVYKKLVEYTLEKRKIESSNKNLSKKRKK